MRRRAALFIIALLLGVFATPMLRADEPKDELSVEHIIKKIRENEALYDNIELVFDETYKVQNAQVSASSVLNSTKSIRMVYRGESQFRRVDESIKVINDENNKVEDLRWVNTYVSDGKSTRNLREEKGKFSAEIVSDEGLPRGQFQSHLLLMFQQFSLIKEPLTGILESRVLDRGFSHQPIPTTIVVEETKHETIDGFACIKLACKTTFVHPKRPTEPRNSFLTLWLAKDRNYLPICLTLVHPANHDKLPSVASAASDLREISPGVWFPFRVRVDSFSREELKNGKAIKSIEHGLDFKKVVYKPKYDAEFFRDLPFPKGTPVVVKANKRPIMSYIEGDESSRKMIPPMDLEP